MQPDLNQELRATNKDQQKYCHLPRLAASCIGLSIDSACSATEKQNKGISALWKINLRDRTIVFVRATPHSTVLINISAI